MNYIARIEGGRVKVYNVNGCLQYFMGETNAVSVSVQGDILAVSYADGKVKVFNATYGRYLFDVSFSYKNAVSVSVQGDNLVVTYANGKVCVFNASNGCFRYTL